MNRKLFLFVFVIFFSTTILSQEENSYFLKMKLVDYVKLYNINMKRFKLVQVNSSASGFNSFEIVEKECEKKFKEKIPYRTLVVLEFEEKFQPTQTRNLSGGRTGYLIIFSGLALVEK